MIRRIVLATGNSGKLAELQMLAGQYEITLLAQSDFAVTSVDETGTSFLENATIKAEHATRHTQMPAIADDSGLLVDYLDGEPGLLSARYAGPESSDQDNRAKLLQALQNTPKAERTARFVCAMVYMRYSNDPEPLSAIAYWSGYILNQEVGSHGFGYDSIFYVPEYRCSAAELEPQIKNSISHRAIAATELLQAINIRDMRHE